MPARLAQLASSERPNIEPLTDQAPDRSSFVDHLAAVRQGHVFISAAGSDVYVTPRVYRLLEDHEPARPSSVHVRDFIRMLSRSTGLPVSTLIARFRAAKAGLPLTSDVTLADRTLQIEVHLVAAGGWTVTIEDVSLRRAAEATAAEMARLDPLTNLPNRLMLRERLDQALGRLRRTGEGCAVLLLDLDRFKTVNDTLGHAIGDALLKKVADRLRSTVRETDTVARIGGDEFVMLQTGITSAADVEALARRIVDLVGRTYVIEGQLLSIGASVGIAVAPDNGTAVETLLQCADLALYRSKNEGRGTYRFFEPEMNARMQARRQLELNMRQALARREFELYYQPQVNLENGRLVGCEALIRWMHPSHGQISPLDFIPLAEELGLIVPIGEWVIRQACRDAVGWPLPLTVAVNVSPAQFKSERLVETIVSALAFSSLPAQRLEVEITEGVLLQDNDKVLGILHRLRALGVRVSMDDFGTGYSSLSYLRSFPFDKIKIDRSFVRDMAGSNTDSNAIIRAISGLGRSLGMTTVAEGVETLEQMQRIRAEGCTDIQGYFISKPIPASDIIGLMTSYIAQPILT